MRNNKIRLSLINDYLKILKVDFALKNSSFNDENSKSLNEKLKTCYENLLFKFNLMDVSLLVLKKEIYSCSNKIKMDIVDIKKIQKDTLFLLFSKIKSLKLNDVETKFITKILL